MPNEKERNRDLPPPKVKKPKTVHQPDRPQPFIELEIPPPEFWPPSSIPVSEEESGEPIVIQLL